MAVNLFVGDNPVLTAIETGNVDLLQQLTNTKSNLTVDL